MSLKFWSDSLLVASILVILGVILEGHELLVEFKEKGLRPIWTKLGFSLLVIGLMLELFFQSKLQSADEELKRQSDVKIALLTSVARAFEGRIADAQRDAANANERAGQANKDAAEARERAAALEAQAANLERAVSPRIVDQGQMGQFLKPFSKTTVRTLAVLDFEARRLGATLNVGFEIAGWNTFSSQSSSANFPDGVTVVCAGVRFFRNSGVFSEQASRSVERAEKAASAIMESLKQDNIVATASRLEATAFCITGSLDVCAALPAPGDILILVGAKPLDPMIMQKRVEEFRKRNPNGIVLFGNQ